MCSNQQCHKHHTHDTSPVSDCLPVFFVALPLRHSTVISTLSNQTNPKLLQPSLTSQSRTSSHITKEPPPQSPPPTFVRLFASGPAEWSSSSSKRQPSLSLCHYNPVLRLTTVRYETRNLACLPFFFRLTSAQRPKVVCGGGLFYCVLAIRAYPCYTSFCSSAHAVDHFSLRPPPQRECGCDCDCDCVQVSVLSPLPPSLLILLFAPLCFFFPIVGVVGHSQFIHRLACLCSLLPPPSSWLCCGLFRWVESCAQKQGHTQPRFSDLLLFFGLCLSP